MHDDPRSDEQLIEAIKAGDARAFECLYRRHRDWVIQLAYRFTHDRDAALDVMQEVFLYVLGKCPGLRLTARFTTFLYPVTKHIAASHCRKVARERTPVEAIAEPAAVTSAPSMDARDGLAHILADLPEAQREVVLLRFVDGLSLEEIAQAVELPLGTVKSRLHHAIKHLRDDPRTEKYFQSH